VTHNPDLECYADRILYVEDGTFKKQAINSQQTRIEFDACEPALFAVVRGTGLLSPPACLPTWVCVPHTLACSFCCLCRHGFPEQEGELRHTRGGVVLSGERVVECRSLGRFVKRDSNARHCAHQRLSALSQKD
jgi:hypothetical protein